MNGSRYSYGKIEDREESFIRRDSVVSDDRRLDVCRHFRNGRLFSRFFIRHPYISKWSYAVFRIEIDASLIPLRSLDRFLSLFVSSFVENSAKRIIVDLFEFLLQCYAKAFLQHLVQDFTLTKTTVRSAYA